MLRDDVAGQHGRARRAFDRAIQGTRAGQRVAEARQREVTAMHGQAQRAGTSRVAYAQILAVGDSEVAVFGARLRRRDADIDPVVLPLRLHCCGQCGRAPTVENHVARQDIRGKMQLTVAVQPQRQLPGGDAGEIDQLVTAQRKAESAVRTPAQNAQLEKIKQWYSYHRFDLETGASTTQTLKIKSIYINAQKAFYKILTRNQQMLFEYISKPEGMRTRKNPVNKTPRIKK